MRDESVTGNLCGLLIPEKFDVPSSRSGMQIAVTISILRASTIKVLSLICWHRPLFQSRHPHSRL